MGNSASSTAGELLTFPVVGLENVINTVLSSFILLMVIA